MKFKYWIPTCIMLILIWGNSLINGHFSTMISAFIKALLFHQDYNMVILYRSDGLLRKIAHFSEFLILCLTCLYGLYKTNKDKKPYYVFIFLIVAVIDETIQLFVADRNGSIKDVLLDWSGFLCGFIIAMLILKLKHKAWFKDEH